MQDDRPFPARPGPLAVICGPMFAGKTTELLRRIDAARAAGAGVVVAKPGRDTRYSADHLATHAGARLEARRVESLWEVVRHCEDARGATSTDLVAIDEIHFFSSDAVAPIDALRARGVGVIVAGCELDHFGETFAPFDALLPRATEVVRIAGACARCGAPSTHSERLVATTERIVVGGLAEFVATCARCFRPSRRDDGRRESTKD